VPEQTYEEWLAEVQRKRAERKVRPKNRPLVPQRSRTRTGRWGPKGFTKRQKKWNRVLLEDPCTFCGHYATKGNPMTIDHLTPWSLGGSNAWENLAAACYRCNQQRGNGSPLLLMLVQLQRGQSRVP